MSAAPVLVDVDVEDARYDRQERIAWWDQKRLAEARVLVVGAGALGNEIVKNLALVGVGHLDIVDMDMVEHSNLARCGLLRDGDEGAPKAEVLARAAQALNPDVTATAFVVPVERLGAGFLADVDIVVAGLDNREARLWLNQAARKTGRWWVDGAIEGIQGIARAFGPDGPCYECTLSETDRKVMALRRSCALLTPEEMVQGKVPTNATTASVIAGVQVQEAIKLLHDRHDLLAIAGRGFVFVGETLETLIVTYSEDPDCIAHEHYGFLDRGTPAADATFSEFALAAGAVAGWAIELEDDLILSAACDICAVDQPVGRLAGGCGRDVLVCPTCGTERRLEASHRFGLGDPPGAVRLAGAGLAHRDVVTLRAPDGMTRHIVVEEVPDP